MCYYFLYRLILSERGAVLEILFGQTFSGGEYFQLGRIESCKFVKVSYFSDICGRSVILLKLSEQFYDETYSQDSLSVYKHSGKLSSSIA